VFFLLKWCTQFSSTPCMLHAQPISFSYIATALYQAYSVKAITNRIWLYINQNCNIPNQTRSHQLIRQFLCVLFKGDVTTQTLSFIEEETPFPITLTVLERTKFGHGSRRGPKPRMTLLARTSTKLLVHTIFRQIIG
jgi:hypothetical protein